MEVGQRGHELAGHGQDVGLLEAALVHQHGRVGRGLYFASENNKSAAYTSPGLDKATKKRVGFMFLVEVALGREKTITADDHRLKAAPKGFDCVVARGVREPDESKDVLIRSAVTGKQEVVVPQASAKAKSEYKNSSFENSEYLVYKESQAHLRYALAIEFKY